MEEAGQLHRMMCPACNGRYEGGQFCAKDGTPLVKDTHAAGKEDLVGKILADRYRILRLLGEGGMGQVYEAQHVNINKRFAIKLLRPEIVSNPEAVQRFRQEAWSASSIGHENIIEIDDFATLPNGSVYLAMEFLAGQSLAERMRGGTSLDMGESLEIFAQVCRGLASAHDKGIIHRDMKPENIFLSEKHNRTIVKILDFGIAKVSGAEGSHSLTRTGAIFGTPHYMSPEQALGKPLDLRSDIYSVGVIMYEVFTGRVPFEAESFMGILTKHITSDPKRPTEVSPDRGIPPEVEAVILKAMAKDSADRYGSMAELQNDIIAMMQLFAPHLLTSSGNQPAVFTRPTSPPMTAAGPRPVAPTMLASGQSGLTPVARPTPTGGIKRPSQPVAATMLAPSGSMPVRQPTPPAGVPARDNYDDVPYANPSAAPAKKKPPMGMIVAGLAVLLVGGGALAFVMFKKPPVVAQPAPPPVVAAPQPVAPVVTPPAAPELSTIVVDTEPSQAKILKDGQQIGETPEIVKVPSDGTVKIVLKKDGYVEETVTVDPSKGRKVVVKLDKIRTASVKAPKVHLPKLPVYSTPTAPVASPAKPPVTIPVKPVVVAPVVTTPPTVSRPVPPPVKQRPVDPYERLDDKPAPKKPSGDVLNPY